MNRDQIAITILDDGRLLGMLTYKLYSIPSYNLLGERLEEVLNQVKDSFNNLLIEYYQCSIQNDSSIEINWINHPAINQSYQADIDIYITIRITNQNQEVIFIKLEEISRIINFNLSLQKIQINQCEYPLNEYFMSNPNLTQARAIRKKEDIMYMQNGILNNLYIYDSYSDSFSELENIVNYLLYTSSAIISIELIPTRYYDQEIYYIDKTVNSLSNLLNGVSVPQYGLIRDGMVETPLKVYQAYNNQNQALFIQNLIAIGSVENINNVASKVLIECSIKGKDEKIPHFEIIEVNDAANYMKNYPFVYPWMINQLIMKMNRIQLFNSNYYSYLYRLPSIVTSNEVSTIFRIPVGSNKITAGIKIEEIEKRNKSYTKGIINTADIILGKLQNIVNQEDTNIGFNLKDLTRHMMVVGTPGSGKSTFLVGLMDRLWKNHHIPFLVIEPAKNEYRSLIDSIPDLQIFSPGKNNVAPYIINPFIPPKKVSLEIYKSIVKSAFSVAFEMWTPLDQLFDETLNICYSDCGWLDETTIEDGRRCFTLSDFIETYREVVNSKGYTGEYKKQIETAGVMRLNGLLEQNVNIFDNQNTVSIEDVLSKPTVIELSNIKEIKQKAFIIGLLLNNIYAYVEANLNNDGELKNVILLEEAHVLLSGDNIASTSEGETANSAAVKLLANMLAEIRSRGVGIVVADQSPRKVSSEVVGNTNIKIMFRLVEAVDKKIVMNSTTMNDTQYDRLSRLRTGQALIYFDKLDDVEEILFDDYRLKNNISTDLKDETIRQKMHYWDDKKEILIPYEECHYLEECKNECNFDTRSKARVISDRIYRKYMNGVKDMNTFKGIYSKINSLIKEETLEVFDEETFYKIKNCVKVHFLRKVSFTSEVKISRMLRINTIKAIKKGV